MNDGIVDYRDGVGAVVIGRMATVVVVGGGLAGLRTVEELRKAGHCGELVLVGAEPHLPYERPPLSKEVLAGTRDAATTRLRGGGFFADHGVKLWLGSRAAALDLRHRTVELDSGAGVGFDHLVIATGVEPRPLPGVRDLSGVHTLRSLDDCLALRSEAGTARRAVVVGAGLIGCEVTASLRALGLEVVLVERCGAPLPVFGVEVGGLVARLHVAAGADLRCGSGAGQFLGDRWCAGVRLADGTELDADLVVVGVGSAPSTGWLAGSGLTAGDGVRCDGYGRTAVPGVWAVGDVASWSGRRVEHWASAVEQARIVAAGIVGAPPPARSLPTFWTDQYGLRIHVLGDLARHDEVEVIRAGDRRFLATYSLRGKVVAVVAAGMAAAVARIRRAVAAPGW